MAREVGIVGAFPDGKSALMLVAARLRHVAGWDTRSYLGLSRLKEPVEASTQCAELSVV